MSATRIIRGARKLDAGGQVDDFWLAAEGERIVATGSGSGWRAYADGAETTDAGGRWLTPGFIDLHSHGAGGAAYEGDPDEMAVALETHRRHGTTRSVLSLVANPLAELRECLEDIADLVEADPLVLGSHLEGPFLNPDRRGAHNVDFLRTPDDPELVEQLIAAARGTLRQITIAPELPGAMEAIDVLVEAGVVVAVGHTEATEDQAKAAFDRGARLLTHAFNAMPSIQHRAPGPIIAAFDDDRVVLELILDGFHVHPDVAHLAFVQAPGRIALITDSMAAAGAADGDYRLGSLNVTVTDGKALLSGTNSIAGSTLTQDVALKVAVERTRIEPAVAVEALTLTPARVLGLDHELGRLAPGYLADAVLLDHEWSVRAVWAAGATLV
ncbi:N-acetylglucosamine-6-phosphate deacetylase [Planctomonas sp. JC2975]|uniref:N-acetylglucosamine-6-phosphate deacetylase n=1 Tax=Planctomonas sp. JC2975 TaxID=2729626 RepID=UPI0014757538|nr:N-acetylglucosamine-6-phosphate deacetylase [Planctomonas sp. JC2975]NNC11726.1 N-acetylglucosamine-6-phosphate deacetylase [Planctomonas sp. JC2975]